MAPSVAPSTDGIIALRKDLNARRRALDAATLQRTDAALTRRLIPLLARTTHVAGYLAIRGEASLAGTLAGLRARGISTAVPRVTGDAFVFVAIDDSTPMRAGHFGIAEPEIAANADALDPMCFDAILIPLVAFDEAGNRVGMGGGFYDRYLEPVASRRRNGLPVPRLIGVAHAFQQVDRLTPEPWDVPLDMVVTELAEVQAKAR